MKRKYTIKLDLFLSDRNRNFGEVLESIYKAIEIKDGVDSFQVVEETLHTNKIKKTLKQIKDMIVLNAKGDFDGMEDKK